MCTDIIAHSNTSTLLSPGDTLAVAGDFFDTKYGHFNSTDYNPVQILNEFRNLPNITYYVYGNCDDTTFCPGYHYTETFLFDGLRIMLSHGNFEIGNGSEFDILITGHTHIRNIRMKKRKIYMNPGSLALPKDPSPSWAVIEGGTIKLMGLNEGVVKEVKIHKNLI